ncbi:hypothetical protein BGZ63DRAFT_420854 [Mariannaea sp. PMI_226]|nr:hypothetical protein BGZ63DRAFT_420854 [Mariannaea sp. PMI_226]
MATNGDIPPLADKCRRLIDELVPQITEPVMVNTTWTILIQDIFIALRAIADSSVTGRQVDLNEPAVYSELRVLASQGLHGSVYINGVYFGFQEASP